MLRRARRTVGRTFDPANGTMNSEQVRTALVYAKLGFTANSAICCSECDEFLVFGC